MAVERKDGGWLETMLLREQRGMLIWRRQEEGDGSMDDVERGQRGRGSYDG